MSLIFATQLTAVATAVLAVFAIVTAFYARQAFRKQSQEVSAIERQVKDQQELTRQQAELLKIQSGRLELQGQQLDDQRKASADQAEVLKLQADELRESLAARQRAAEEQRKAQASKVFIVEAEGLSRPPSGPPAVPFVVARAVNSSDQPVYDVEIYWRRGSASHGEPNPEPLGILMPGERKKRAATFRARPTWPSAAPSSDSGTQQASAGSAGPTAASASSRRAITQRRAALERPAVVTGGSRRESIDSQHDQLGVAPSSGRFG